MHASASTQANPSTMSDLRWEAVLRRDKSADGTFYSAVRTTGVFCKPSCPARPLRRNVIAFDTPEEAMAAGFRACKRCRPLG